jgi:hypothetical protein
MIITTGKEAAGHTHPLNGGQHDDAIKAYLVQAPAKELHDFIHNIIINPHSSYLTWARTALDIKLAEEAANTAQKLLETADTQKQLLVEAGKQAENLSIQTNKLVEETVTLTRLTRGLHKFTVVLVIVAIIQVIIMLFDLFTKKP